MLDLRPALIPMFTAFGVAATVTPLGGAPVTALVIGGSPLQVTQEAQADPVIADFRRRCSVRKSEVATLPVGSTILAPEGFVLGQPLVTYVVDLTEDLDPEVWHAVVHE